MKNQDEKRQRFREDLQGLLSTWRSDGSNLGESLFGFVKTLALRDVFKARHPRARVRNDRAMNGRERGRKRELRLKLRQGLRDLARITRHIEPRFTPIRPWFTVEDVREVYDIHDLATVVMFAVDLLGDEYAERLLTEIQRHYQKQGKAVEVVQRFGFA